MGRKVWRRPLTRVQQFEANEYVAACGTVEWNIILDVMRLEERFTIIQIGTAL